MKKQAQNTTPAYGWESPAVRAALEGKGWLWISIKEGFTGRRELAAWYPPRIARYIMSMLRDLGSCEPVNEWWAYQVRVAGPGQQKGYFKHFHMSKLTALLWGLHFYHRKVARQLKRDAARTKARIHDSWILGRVFEHTIEGGRVVARPKQQDSE